MQHLVALVAALGAALAPFRSAERSCLGRRNQMIAVSWGGSGNNEMND